MYEIIQIRLLVKSIDFEPYWWEWKTVKCLDPKSEDELVCYNIYEQHKFSECTVEEVENLMVRLKDKYKNKLLDYEIRVISS